MRSPAVIDAAEVLPVEAASPSSGCPTRNLHVQQQPYQSASLNHMQDVEGALAAMVGVLGEKHWLQSGSPLLKMLEMQLSKVRPAIIVMLSMVAQVMSQGCAGN